MEKNPNFFLLFLAQVVLPSTKTSKTLLLPKIYILNQVDLINVIYEREKFLVNKMS